MENIITQAIELRKEAKYQESRALLATLLSTECTHFRQETYSLMTASIN